MNKGRAKSLTFTPDSLVHYQRFPLSSSPVSNDRSPSPAPAIFPILMVNFIGILGLSVVIPILVYIVQDFGGNGFIYGLLGATYPFFQFIGAPLLGRLSDRIGRKKVLLVSQMGTFLSWMLFLLAFFLPEITLWEQQTSLTGNYLMSLPLLLLFVARMCDGFTGGNVSVANAYLSDISTDETRSENFGKMGASSSLGFVVGPAAAGLLATTLLGEMLPVLIAALISLVALFVIQFGLTESNPCVVDTGPNLWKGFRQFFQAEHKPCYTEGQEQMEQESNRGWRRVWAVEAVRPLYVMYFLTFLGFSLFYAGWPIYVSTRLAWTSAELGIFLAYFSLVMVGVQGPVLKWLSKRVTSQRLVWTGGLLLCIGFCFLASPSTALLYVAATIMSIGNGLMWPSFLAMLSRTGPAHLQGSIQGYGSSMGSVASILGLLLGGVSVEIWGNTIFFLSGGLFLLIALIQLTQHPPHASARTG